jgi:hypothetical protein
MDNLLNLVDSGCFVKEMLVYNKLTILQKKLLFNNTIIIPEDIDKIETNQLFKHIKFKIVPLQLLIFQFNNDEISLIIHN